MNDKYINPLNALNAALGEPSFTEFEVSELQPLYQVSRSTAKRVERGVELIPTTVLPDLLQNVFNFDYFNPVQSSCFDTLFNTDTNAVISAPTGAGKTGVIEIALSRAYQNRNLELNCKIIYLAPTRALCSERYDDWKKRLTPLLGLKCGLLTGDNNESMSIKVVRESDLLVTTPEKWDSITRKWKTRSLAEVVQLVLIDEVHTLREQRGSILEVIVTRMRTVCTGVRFVAISATIPNVEDVSTWLSNTDGTNAKLHSFGESFRPVPLEKEVLGFKCNGNQFQFDKTLNHKLGKMFEEYSDKKPVIIFCATRKLCVSTANYVAKNCTQYIGSIVDVSKLRLKDKELFKVSRSGVAFHHAGLDTDDRRLVEAAFMNGQIKVICCTSTLSVGVNLPAHLVIIKGTQTWNGAGFAEYPASELLQMLGRAGRPQFDSSARGVIMTTIDNKQGVIKLLKGNEPVESNLRLNLLEHLTVEVALGTVYSKQSAVSWIKSTFFYQRVRRNPSYYRIDIFEKFSLDSRLEDYCEECLEKLVELEAVRKVGDTYKPTVEGEALTKYYISSKTLQVVQDSPGNLTIATALRMLCSAYEFSEVRLKHNEKRFYREINAFEEIRFPLCKKDLDSPGKLSLICQNEFNGSQLPSYDGASKLYSSYNMDKLIFYKHAPRVLKFMIDCFVSSEDGYTLKSLVELNSAVNARCWNDSPMEIRQLVGMDAAAVRNLASRNCNSLKDFSNLTHHEIDHYIGKGLATGNGRKALNDLALIPKLQLNCNATSSLLEVSLSCENPKFKWNNRYLQLHFLAINDTGKLLHYRHIAVEKLVDPLFFKIQLKDQEGYTIKCHAIQEEIVGFNVTSTARAPGDKKRKSTENSITSSSGSPIKLCLHKCKDKRKCAHVCCRLHLQHELSFQKKRKAEEEEEDSVLIETPVTKKVKNDHSLSSSLEKFDESSIYFTSSKKQVAISSDSEDSLDDESFFAQLPPDKFTKYVELGSISTDKPILPDFELLELLGSDIEIID